MDFGDSDIRDIESIHPDSCLSFGFLPPLTTGLKVHAQILDLMSNDLLSKWIGGILFTSLVSRLTPLNAPRLPAANSERRTSCFQLHGTYVGEDTSSRSYSACIYKYSAAGLWVFKCNLQRSMWSYSRNTGARDKDARLMLSRPSKLSELHHERVLFRRVSETVWSKKWK